MRPGLKCVWACSGQRYAECESSRLRTQPPQVLRTRKNRGYELKILRSVVTHNLCQSDDEAIDLLRSVVVDEANPEKTARFFHVKMFGKVHGVVVAVPGEEAAIA